MKLQSFHMRCQRRIMGARWFDFVSNASISSATGLGDVGSVICARRLDLLGLVARLDHTVPAWKALDVALRAKGGAVPSPRWHQPRGRPRRTWVDHVKEHVAVRLDSVMLLAADRQAWRSLRYGPSLTKRVWWWWLAEKVNTLKLALRYH